MLRLVRNTSATVWLLHSQSHTDALYERFFYHWRTLQARQRLARAAASFSAQTPIQRAPLSDRNSPHAAIYAADQGGSMNDKSDTLALEKVPSGIKGFDDITSGGFPKARTTLILGGPGCGKSVLALQALIGGTTRRLASSSPSRKMRNASAPTRGVSAGTSTDGRKASLRSRCATES